MKYLAALAWFLVAGAFFGLLITDIGNDYIHEQVFSVELKSIDGLMRDPPYIEPAGHADTTVLLRHQRWRWVPGDDWSGGFAIQPGREPKCEQCDD